MTSMCEMFGQFIQKKHEEEQAANARYWKILACCDDDDDYNFAITPNEPVDSLSMGDEHLNTILATESDEFIKSSVENLVPNPSDDDQSLYDEDVPEKIFSNPLFEEKVIPMKIDQHHDNAESDLVESLRIHDSSLIISSKIDSLLDEFVGELTLLKSIPPGIKEIDCDPEEDIRLIERLLYDNSSPHLSKEFVSENSNADIESFSPSPIPVEDSDSLMEEIDLSLTLDDPMPPGIKEDDYDSERDTLILEELLDNYSLSLHEKSHDLLSHQGLENFQLFAECPMMIHGKNTPILDVPLFYFYPLDQLNIPGNLNTLAKGFCPPDEFEFDSVDDQSLHNEDVSEKIFSNPLFEEEIISIRIDQHHFNAESDLVESMLNRNSSVISSSLKIDSLLDEFIGELTLLKSIPPGIDKTDCQPENEIRLSQRLLYDNSSPRLPKEFNSENSYADIESFYPSPIPNEDSDSFMEEIDLFLTPDDPMPPSIEDDDDSEGDILFLERLLHDDPIPLPDTLDFSYEVRISLPFFTYPMTSPNLLSSGSEDTIFDPGITVNRFYSF
nr:hypothetical protein [Tanacetum cinerariifolium]